MYRLAVNDAAGVTGEQSKYSSLNSREYDAVSVDLEDRAHRRCVHRCLKIDPVRPRE
jgi:hypothetical protein